MAYVSMFERERLLREAREQINVVETAVLGLMNTLKGNRDSVTLSTLAKLKTMPSPYYRSVPQLKISHFLLLGLICRNSSGGAWKREQLDKLKRIVL